MTRRRSPSRCRAGKVISPFTGRCILPPSARKSKMPLALASRVRSPGRRRAAPKMHCVNDEGRPAHCVGTRRQVYEGYAVKTSGGLRAKDLLYIPKTSKDGKRHGRIVSVRRHVQGLSQYNPANPRSIAHPRYAALSGASKRHPLFGPRTPGFSATMGLSPRTMADLTRGTTFSPALASTPGTMSPRLMAEILAGGSSMSPSASIAARPSATVPGALSATLVPSRRSRRPRR